MEKKWKINSFVHATYFNITSKKKYIIYNLIRGNLSQSLECAIPVVNKTPHNIYNPNKIDTEPIITENIEKWIV